jgi:hypothetical protein
MMVVILPTNEYKPYKPKARWRKWIIRNVEQPITKKIHSMTYNAMLYLPINRKKRENNLKKGRQKGRKHNYVAIY